MQPAHLRAHEVVKAFTQDASTITVLDKISYTFVQGHTYAITGLSGMGKSTFLHLIAGIDTPDAGSVSFNDVDIRQFSPSERTIFFNQSLGLAFQHPYLIKELTVMENVMIPGIINGRSEEECKARCSHLLQLTGLGAKANALPGTLSGGQQQRAALARAVFNQPNFLLADEPTGSLDEITSKSIVELLRTYQKEWGMGIIVATHDPLVTQSMNTTLHVHNGHLIDISSKGEHATKSL